MEGLGAAPMLRLPLPPSLLREARALVEALVGLLGAGLAAAPPQRPLLLQRPLPHRSNFTLDLARCSAELPPVTKSCKTSGTCKTSSSSKYSVNLILRLI